MSTEQQPVPSGSPEGQRTRRWGFKTLPEVLARVRTELPLLAPRRSIGTKLIVVLGAAMLITFGALGWMNMYQSRKTVEQTTFLHAARVSDVVVRSATNYMMRNDRLALYEMMTTIAEEPGVVRLRIINTEGRISFSTDPEEIGKTVDKGAELCSGCHTDPQSLSLADAHERFRIYRKEKQRVLAVVTPINNEPSCSTAACHAHPGSTKVLGVLDTHMSLSEVDLSTASNDRRMLFYTILAAGSIGLLSWIFIYRMVHMPLHKLKSGTDRLAKGDLGFQIEASGDDETGELAQSFNTMSRQLREAHDEITAWTHTLEGRVEQKTRELKRAHDQMMTVEKTLTIGEMAAVVAHEINNPLAGILTYAKLVRKWIQRGIGDHKAEAEECLELIAAESKRCGDLVNNLLTFSHRSPIHMESTDLNTIIRRAIKLIQHRTDMQGVQVQVSTEAELPAVYCDGSQIEQVLLALIMNALDAMPHGGNLWVSSRLLPASEVELVVRDDGMGIPPELLPKIFEPFTTTKEVGKGVGLGCAISKGIVERHGGRIDLKSDLGVGTTFRVYLPLDARVSETAQTALAGITN
jgi:two-component system, NtrC family, sensor kinase